MMETKDTIQSGESVRDMLSVAGSLQDRDADVKGNSRASTGTGSGVTLRSASHANDSRRPSVLDGGNNANEPIVLFPLRYQETPFNGGRYVQHTISDGKNRPLLRYTAPAYNTRIGPQVTEIVKLANRGAETLERAATQ